MVAANLKWNGGYLWACKNYDGDVQSDTVAQGYGSLGLMTQRADVAGRQDGRGRGRARHRHAALPRCTSRASRPAPTRSRRSTPGRAACIYRGKMDGTPDVVKFAETLEKVCVDMVESGKMTKDLAILICDKAPHLTTDEYLDAVDAELKKRMG